MNNSKKYFLSLLFQNIILILTIMIMCLSIWFMFLVVVEYINKTEIETPIIEEETEESQTVGIIIPFYREDSDKKVYALINYDGSAMSAQNQYDAKMLELEFDEVDKEQWYAEYKKILSAYSQYLDAPKTIYDVFSEYEIYLIQRAVETEVYQCDFDSKVNVASVIFNRIEDGRFGNTVSDVITRPGQFAWHRTKISDSTKLAVEYAFEIGDTTDGCIAFRSDRKPERWGKWVYFFSDNAVHHFYKEQEQ